MNTPLSVLCAGAHAPDLATSAFGPFELQACASWAQAAERLRERAFDALLLQLDSTFELNALTEAPGLAHAVFETALVVVAPEAPPALAMRLVRLGIQDLLSCAAATDPNHVARAVRLSVERKRLEIAARRTFATDLSTGLPNHAQLLEHMSHLLALREREPAPMALLVLRIEGLATTERALGIEASNVLRRKVAVRLRAGLRASDVVASIGVDSFAVLLAWIDSPADAQRVANKLALALQQPFSVAGQGLAVAVSVGLSQYPEHGKGADELLRRALGQAGATAAAGRAGFAGFAGFAKFVERGASGAANDEGPATR